MNKVMSLDAVPEGVLCRVYFDKIAQSSGYSEGVQSFTVPESIHRKIIVDAAKNDGFVDKIGHEWTDDFEGYLLEGVIQSFPVGRSKTGYKMHGDVDSSNDVNVAMNTTGSFYDNKFVMQDIDANFFIKKSIMMRFSNVANFLTTMSGYFLKSVADAMQVICFAGTSVAEETDPVNEGSDLFVGFPQLINDQSDTELAVSNYRTDVDKDYNGDTLTPVIPGQITIKNTNTVSQRDFKSFDLMILWAKHKIPANKRGGLVAFVSDDVAANLEGFVLNENAGNAHQKMFIGQSLKTYSGIPAVALYGMPRGSCMITSYDNLKVVHQKNSFTRSYGYNANKKSYEFLNNWYMTLAISNFKKIVFLTNIKFV